MDKGLPQSTNWEVFSFGDIHIAGTHIGDAKSLCPGILGCKNFAPFHRHKRRLEIIAMRSFICLRHIFCRQCHTSAHNRALRGQGNQVSPGLIATLSTIVFLGDKKRNIIQVISHGPGCGLSISRSSADRWPSSQQRKIFAGLLEVMNSKGSVTGMALPFNKGACRYQSHDSGRYWFQSRRRVCKTRTLQRLAEIGAGCRDNKRRGVAEGRDKSSLQFWLIGISRQSRPAPGQSRTQDDCRRSESDITPRHSTVPHSAPDSPYWQAGASRCLATKTSPLR